MVERNGYFHHDDPEHEPQREISRVQRIHLELIRLASFNDFHGDQVAHDLETYPQLWKAAMMGNFGHGGELLVLRDMERGLNNVDTLMVLTTEEHAPAMEEMAWTWRADEVGWLPEEEAGEALGLSPVGDLRLLRCWWG